MPELGFLRSAGIDPFAESVYRKLLVGGSHLQRLADDLDCCEGQVAQALGRLCAKGLAAKADDTTYRAVDPEVALRTLRNAREIEVLRAREELAVLDLRIAEFLEQAPAEVVPAGERISGAEGRLARVEKLYASVTATVEATLTRRLRSEEISLLLAAYEVARHRSVRCRVIVPLAVRSHRETRQLADRLCAIGVKVRTLPVVPAEMVIGDGSDVLTSVIDAAVETVAIGHPAVATLASAQFSMLWREAESWAIGSDDFSEMPARLEQDRSTKAQSVLEQLAAGHSDSAIARRLAVSERTVRRIIAELYERTGARNRFVLGLYAARDGWLEESQELVGTSRSVP